MSASLVGSEMCIRDRHLQEGLLPVVHVLGEGRATRMPGQLRSNVGVVPVSYTHLTLPTICSV
eukprot:2668910-Alexandrium_andersonii.AAC.1